ncbi:MAG: hypothetical protein ABIG87_01520 [Patescibacteria group bacterium]
MKIVKIKKSDRLPFGEYTLVYSPKIKRVEDKFGKFVSDRNFLIEYDKIGGWIKDQDGNKIEMHTFWNIEKERIKKYEEKMEKWDNIKNDFYSFAGLIRILKEFIWLFLFILSLIVYFFYFIIQFLKRINENNCFV